MAVLSKLYSNLINRNINAQKEILVTYGASEALYCAILGHVDKDDEVILIEPFYNSYLPMILAAGGTPRYVTLKLVSMIVINITKKKYECIILGKSKKGGHICQLDFGSN